MKFPIILTIFSSAVWEVIKYLTIMIIAAAGNNVDFGLLHVPLKSKKYAQY